MELVTSKMDCLNKSDLHVHLNGAIPKDTIIKYISDQNIAIPKNFNLSTDLQITSPVTSLRGYFLPWEVLKLLPRDYNMLFIMVDEAIGNLVRDNVKYVEFRNSPFYISRLNDIPLSEAITWLVEAVYENSIKHNIEAKLILSLTRHELKEKQGLELLQAIKKANRYNVIVGVDMAGDENVNVPETIKKFFIKAKTDYGLKTTIHAGETGNIENINWAIEECLADRIGHGSAACYSDYTLNLIKEKEICLEVCLYSNTLSGNCKNILSHPVQKFIELDIPFVLCSDNPTVHNKTLSDEYLLFVNSFNRRDIINEMEDRNRKYSFK